MNKCIEYNLYDEQEIQQHSFATLSSCEYWLKNHNFKCIDEVVNKWSDDNQILTVKEEYYDLNKSQIDSCLSFRIRSFLLEEYI